MSRKQPLHFTCILHAFHGIRQLRRPAAAHERAGVAGFAGNRRPSAPFRLSPVMIARGRESPVHIFLTTPRKDQQHHGDGVPRPLAKASEHHWVVVQRRRPSRLRSRAFRRWAHPGPPRRGGRPSGGFRASSSIVSSQITWPSPPPCGALIPEPAAQCAPDPEPRPRPVRRGAC